MTGFRNACSTNDILSDDWKNKKRRRLEDGLCVCGVIEEKGTVQVINTIRQIKTLRSAESACAAIYLPSECDRTLPFLPLKVLFGMLEFEFFQFGVERLTDLL